MTDSGLTRLNRAQLLTEDDYLAKLEQHGDDFPASMGAEGMRELLKALDVATCPEPALTATPLELAL